MLDYHASGSLEFEKSMARSIMYRTVRKTVNDARPMQPARIRMFNDCCGIMMM